MNRCIDEKNPCEVLVDTFGDEGHDLRLLGRAGATEIIRVEAHLDGAAAEGGDDGLRRICRRRGAGEEKKEEQESCGDGEGGPPLSVSLEIQGKGQKDRGTEGEAIRAVDAGPDLVADQEDLPARAESQQKETQEGFPEPCQKQNHGHVEDAEVFEVDRQDIALQIAA